MDIPPGRFGREMKHEVVTVIRDNPDAYLDAILADDAPRLLQLIQSHRFPSADVQLQFTRYKFPPPIEYSPSLLAAAAYFRAEKCFFNLLQLHPTLLKGDLPICAAAGGSLGILSAVESLRFPFRPLTRGPCADTG
jgi:hypothetical protein